MRVKLKFRYRAIQTLMIKKLLEFKIAVSLTSEEARHMSSQACLHPL